MEDYYRAVDVTWRTKIWEIEALWHDKKKWNTLTDEHKREKILELQNIASQYSRDFANRFDHDRDLVKWDTNLAQRSGEAQRLAYWMNDELTKKIDKELKQEIRNGARTLMAFSRSVNKGTRGPVCAAQKSNSTIKKSKPSRADRLATRNAKKENPNSTSIVELNDEYAVSGSLALSNASDDEASAPYHAHPPEAIKSYQRDIKPINSHLDPVPDPLDRDEIASILISLGSSTESQIAPHDVDEPDYIQQIDQHASANRLKRKRCADIPEKNEADSPIVRPSKIIKLSLSRSRMNNIQRFNMFPISNQANTCRHEQKAESMQENEQMDFKGSAAQPSPVTGATRDLPRRSSRMTVYKYKEENSEEDTDPKPSLRSGHNVVKYTAKHNKNSTVVSGLLSSTPGRNLTDVICTSSDPEALQGDYYLLNQFGYPAYDKTAGRYLKKFADTNGVQHSSFDQAVHLTVRLEHKETHEILEKTFPHPEDWNDPNDVKKAMKAAQQFCRRKAGAPGKKVRYSDEEVKWLKTYVASKTKVNWAAVNNMSSEPWKALWRAWQVRFPESKRGEEALWAKCGAGSDESRLGIINY